MLYVEVDLFSGRPNPQWIVTDQAVTNRILAAVRDAPDAIADVGAGYKGLGFREVRVRLLGDDEPRRRGIRREFALASAAAKEFRASSEVADRVIDTMPRQSDVRLVAHELTPLSKEIRDVVAEWKEAYVRLQPGIDIFKYPPAGNPLRTTIHDEKCQDCQYEISQFNPGFWNVPAVQPHNNCYNYGRNWRTDTFAQPGRAHGAQTNNYTCTNVTNAAMADGLKKRCDCLPQSEYPRRLMALVVAPGYDYHWYRHQRGGFWGHKPGQTAARNTDNNNALVVSPETAARLPYTDFCGYFYAGLSVVIN